MRLYIAEDNASFASYCAKVATAKGWEVSIHPDGGDLLSAVKGETRPALLLIDIRMPVLDGIEVIQKLRGQAARFRIRFVTGGPDATASAARMIAESHDMHVGKIITKPIGLEDLRALLDEEEGELQKLAA